MEYYENDNRTQDSKELNPLNGNKEQIKIIVCDLNMPRLGGRSILQKVLDHQRID